MGTDQTDFTEQELLATHPLAEPLVRRRGALPRRVRRRTAPTCRPAPSTGCPAIEAWQAQHARAVRHRAARPADRHLARATTRTSPRPGYLIEIGAPEPIISDLTRIGTVEGFGAMIRNSILPDLQQTLRRGHPRHRDRPPRRRPLRGARPRRGRLRGRGRPQADVVRQPRHRVRGPGHRGQTVADARAHGHRHAGHAAARSTPPRCGPGRHGQPHPPRRHRLRARVAARPDDPAAASSRSRRSTPSRGPRSSSRDTDLVAGDGEAGRARVLHPGRRDPARRVPAHGAHRDARPHRHRARRAGTTPGAT